MKPRPIRLSDKEIFPGNKQTFKCPPNLENCEPVETIISRVNNAPLIRIPWEFSEDELEELRSGNYQPTIWLTIFSNVLSPVDLQIYMEGKIIQQTDEQKEEWDKEKNKDPRLQKLAPLSQSAEETDLKSAQ